MAPSKSEGQILLQKAEKKAASSTGWFSSASTKFEEAGDLFQQAANAFASVTRWCSLSFAHMYRKRDPRGEG